MSKKDDLTKKIVEVINEARADEEALSMEELENVEGGLECGIGCDPGCLLGCSPGGFWGGSNDDDGDGKP